MKLEEPSNEEVEDRRRKKEVEDCLKFACEARDLSLWDHAVNLFDNTAAIAAGLGFNSELKDICAAALEQKALCFLRLRRLSFAKKAFKEAHKLYIELDDGVSIARVNKELKALLSFDELLQR